MYVKNGKAQKYGLLIDGMIVGEYFFLSDKNDRYIVHYVVRQHNKNIERKDWIGIKTKAEGEGLRVTRVY